MSAPQHIGVGAPTGRISSVGEQTCRLPSKLPLGSPQVGYIWRWGADLSAPQPIAVGEPTGRFPRTLPLGARHVGSLDTAVYDESIYGVWYTDSVNSDNNAEAMVLLVSNAVCG